MCLISSSTPAVPSSWHAYNPATGNFDVSFYGTGGTYSPEGQSCPVVGSPQIPLGMMPTQLTYNSYLGLYVMVGYSEGAYMLTSPDLINWSLPTKVIGEYWPFPPNGISGSSSSTSNDCYKAYPTLLDPADTSTNFESSGQNAFNVLYALQHISCDFKSGFDIHRSTAEFSVNLIKIEYGG